MKLYRRRFIPDELIYLKDDKVIYTDGDRIVTSWEVLTKRHDFSCGISCYYINEGIKVSRFMNDKGELVYWYCDIIETEYDERTDSYTFKDLLADVIIYPDNSFKVVDLDEIALAIEKRIISSELICACMRRLDTLLNKLYSGEFSEYKSFIEGFVV
jgi:protein associated with RNAse G/E